MKILDNFLKCTGCTACEEVCPVGCISMTQNEQGFLYPVIDQENCSDCGLCTQICPEGKPQNKLNQTIKVYAIKHKSDLVRLESSSGGFFTVLYKYVIAQGGVVFGVRFDRQMRVVHAKATTTQGCKKFRGSKYVQSTKIKIFREVKKELKNDKIVLFTGTPCEIAGLNSYLKKPQPNLITCDLICHGVPSPKLWDDYVHYLYKKMNSPIKSFSFRDKSNGWDKMSIRKQFDDHEIITPINEEPFGYLFGKNLILRKSCYFCNYANLHRPSDITMGDFWAINIAAPTFDDNKGVSQILINTEKGKTIFNETIDEFNSIETKIDDSLQHNLKWPTPMNPCTEKFWQDYSEKGFSYIIKNYKPRYIYTKKILKRVKILNPISKIKKLITN